jgi:Peroxidase
MGKGGTLKMMRESTFEQFFCLKLARRPTLILIFSSVSPAGRRCASQVLFPASLRASLWMLWPIKKKYGSKISWADLIILAGTIHGPEDHRFRPARMFRRT